MSKITGIDVSHHNGWIDWKKVQDSGIKFAIIRCGYGGNSTSKDDIRFSENVTECEKIGMDYGVYLYSYATNVHEAKGEAEHTLRLLKGLKPTFPIWYDVEDKTQNTLSREDISSQCEVYCESLENAGYYAGIYTFKSWYQQKFTDEILKKYDSWLAHWTAKTNYSGPYGMWQYSSRGKVNGIIGNVDMNVAYKDYPLIIKKNHLNAWGNDYTLQIGPVNEELKSKFIKRCNELQINVKVL